MSYGQYSSEHRRHIPARPDLTTKQGNKREKQVFGSNDTGIEHVWANPLTKDGQGYYQTHATNSRKNFYFKTDADRSRVLYSYRDTYPIASLFDIGKGKARKRVYLIRSGKPWGVTTSAHMSAALRAVPDKTNCFQVPYVTRHDNLDAGKYGSAWTRDGKPDKATHKANLADIVTRLTDEIGKLTRARSTWQMNNSHAQALTLKVTAKRYAQLFKVKLPKLPSVPAIDKTKYAKWEAWESQRAAREIALRERQAKECAIKNAETLARWKQGENVSLYGGSQYALLRVVEETATPSEPSRYVVQTSMHATVPVSGRTGAARLLRFLQALKVSGRTYQRNGHTEHIGQFAVDNFDGETLVAGCHRILWSEIESIAQQVTDAEALET
jgi:hypothetical protein